jgi:glutamine synthetase
MFCDITMPDGSPSHADPRNVLRRTLNKVGVRSYRAAKGTSGGETVVVQAAPPPPAPKADRGGGGSLLLQHDAKPPAPKAPKPKAKTLGAVRKGGYEHIDEGLELN